MDPCDLEEGIVGEIRGRPIYGMSLEGGYLRLTGVVDCLPGMFDGMVKFHYTNAAFETCEITLYYHTVHRVIQFAMKHQVPTMKDYVDLLHRTSRPGHNSQVYEIDSDNGVLEKLTAKVVASHTGLVRNALHGKSHTRMVKNHVCIPDNTRYRYEVAKNVTATEQGIMESRQSTIELLKREGMMEVCLFGKPGAAALDQVEILSDRGDVVGRWYGNLAVQVRPGLWIFPFKSQCFLSPAGEYMVRYVGRGIESCVVKVICYAEDDKIFEVPWMTNPPPSLETLWSRTILGAYGPCPVYTIVSLGAEDSYIGRLVLLRSKEGEITALSVHKGDDWFVSPMTPADVFLTSSNDKYRYEIELGPTAGDEYGQNGVSGVFEIQLQGCWRELVIYCEEVVLRSIDTNEITQNNLADEDVWPPAIGGRNIKGQ